METQTSMKGCEPNPELDARIETLRTKISETIPDARFAKFSLEATTTDHAVGLIVALGGGDTIVRHGSGPDWERAFMELDRRLDRVGETD